MFLGMGYNGAPSCCMAGAAVIRLRRFSKATFACNAVREKSSATEKALLCRPHDRALPFEQVTASPRQVSGFLAPLYFFKMWYRWTCDAEASGADDLPRSQANALSAEAFSFLAGASSFPFSFPSCKPNRVSARESRPVLSVGSFSSPQFVMTAFASPRPGLSWATRYQQTRAGARPTGTPAHRDASVIGLSVNCTVNCTKKHQFWAL